MVKERKAYLDYLRIICAILVVGVHTCDDPWSCLRVSGGQWFVLNAVLSLCRCAVPVFFMISGALFLDNSKQITIKDIYGKYVLRMATAFLFWSVLYAVLSEHETVKAFIHSVIKGNYHLWFITSIIGCYIVVPLLRKITESEELTKYFLILCIMFAVVINKVLPLLESVPFGGISYTAELAGVFADSLNIRMVLGYPMYMVLGYYLSKKDFGRVGQVVISCLGVLGYVLMVALTYGYSVAKQRHDDTFFSYFSVPTLLMAVGLFTFGKYFLSKVKINEKASKVVQAVSRYTFGVYLVHVLVLNFLDKTLGLTVESFNPILSIPCVVMLAFLVSLAISAALSKIPFLNKYIV